MEEVRKNEHDIIGVVRIYGVDRWGVGWWYVKVIQITHKHFYEHFEVFWWSSNVPFSEFIFLPSTTLIT